VVAVLAAIILVNVFQYIAKDKNSAVKGNMADLLVEAAVYYGQNGNYTDFNASPKYESYAASISESIGSGPVVIHTTDQTFCACSSMVATEADPAGSTFCVDSTGAKKQTTTDCNTECDAAGVCL